MPKKYQVFVSSTFTDLANARAKVIRALSKMGHIAAGMEYFPAIDEEQFEFIKKIIDDCDYYVILVGNRYGTLSPDGLSYTELEYRYAVSKRLKIIALLHSDPTSLSVKQSDIDIEKSGKLEAFREELRTSRLVEMWSDENELPGLVAISLQTTINAYPSLGWVRGGCKFHRRTAAAAKRASIRKGRIAERNFTPTRRRSRSTRGAASREG